MEASHINMVWIKIFLCVDIKYINNKCFCFTLSSAEILDTVVSYIYLDVVSHTCIAGISCNDSYFNLGFSLARV